MKPKTSRRRKSRAPQPRDGKTRQPDAPLDPALIEAFVEVEPPGFGDHPRSSIEAAAVDPDVDDTEGGE
jgi:hypothetical protein